MYECEWDLRVMFEITQMIFEKELLHTITRLRLQTSLLTQTYFGGDKRELEICLRSQANYKQAR